MHYFEATEETEEPLVDTTIAIPLHSKRTKREEKKFQRKAKAQNNRKLLLDLPAELVMEVIGHLRPSDVFVLQRASKSLRQFIQDNEQTVAELVIKSRYAVIAKCFNVSTFALLHLKGLRSRECLESVLRVLSRHS